MQIEEPGRQNGWTSPKGVSDSFLTSGKVFNFSALWHNCNNASLFHRYDIKTQLKKQLLAVEKDVD